MNLIRETVAEFGRSLGMTQLALRDNGGLVLALGAMGLLALDIAGPNQDAVVISLSRSPTRAATVDLRRLLSTNHHRHRARLPVQVAMRDGKLVAAVVLPQEEFTLPRTIETIRRLDEQLRQTEASL